MKSAFYLIIPLLIACSGDERKYPAQPGTNFDLGNWIEITNAISQKDSLLKYRPNDFLRMLSFQKLDTGTAMKKKIHSLPFNYFIQGEWVKKEDVAELIKSIYSTKISKAPLPIVSSQMPMVNSTVGIEAMHLIEIYRDSTFRYPSLCSTYYFCKPEEQMQKADELNTWWQKHRMNGTEEI